jgi:hypothetical protein
VSPSKHENYSLPSDQRLSDNIIWDAWIDYNDIEKTLHVFLSTNDSSKPSYLNLTYKIKLSDSNYSLHARLFCFYQS